MLQFSHIRNQNHIGLRTRPLSDRRLVRDFLIPHLHDKTFGRSLEWVDPANPTHFRVIFHHKNATSWTRNSASVYEAWDHFKERSPRGNDYYTKSRQRFKAALQKSRDLEKVPLKNGKKDIEIYRIRTHKEILELKKPRRYRQHNSLGTKNSKRKKYRETQVQEAITAVTENQFIESLMSNLQIENFPGLLEIIQGLESSEVNFPLESEISEVSSDSSLADLAERQNCNVSSPTGSFLEINNSARIDCPPVNEPQQTAHNFSDVWNDVFAHFLRDPTVDLN